MSMPGSRCRQSCSTSHKRARFAGLFFARPGLPTGNTKRGTAEDTFAIDTTLVWGAVLVPIGHPEVFGGMWDSNRLHWTRAAAVAEIEEHVIKMGLLPLEWSRGDVQNGDLLIGRTSSPGGQQQYAVLVRSARLPTAERPSDDKIGE